MIKKIILLSFLALISCKSKEPILLYKDTNLVLRSISNTINNFTWDNNTIGERDSISIKNKRELLGIIKSIKKTKGMNTNMNFSPNYAFVLEYNNIIDTLYFTYGLEYGYFVKNDSLMFDKDRKIKKFLLSNRKYRVFMEKDFYYYEKKYYGNTD